MRGLQEIQLERILTTERNTASPALTHEVIGAEPSAGDAHLVQLLLRVLQVLPGGERWVSRIGFHQLCNTLNKTVEDLKKKKGSTLCWQKEIVLYFFHYIYFSELTFLVFLSS